MYLKTLTLRGFKSFASSTTLQLEPGITAVVGPNGSGKSNVVDALSWVMGEQGAKSLRGGKMEDVIFAGTAGRPPLGRAEVVLTIDNSDGALPIDYTEVTISRTMFRSGGSEYAINGNTCRLLDVQELLSDSGIGREMHVIVGQGQLDSVLRATPEERRGFVEEAAGVLKHRKRKEKALRKLEATQGNLTRLGDVLTELRRQLKPLGRQAEVARKAAVIQADVRDARARLLADDIVAARDTMATELADEQALKERRTAAETALREAREAEAQLEQALAADAPTLATAQETWYALTSLRERFNGMAGLARERIRVAESEADDRVPGRDPDELEADARRAQEEYAALQQSVQQAAEALDAAIARRTSAEEEYTAEERRIAGLLRAAADQREGLARLHGQLNALKSRAAGADEEIGRLESSAAAARERAAQAHREFTALESQIAGLSAGESGLDEELEAAETQLAEAEATVESLTARRHEAERRHDALRARTEALELGLSRKDGAGALLAEPDALDGLLGSVASLITVHAGHEVALAAALGAATDALAVADVDAAIGAIERLRGDDLGRARIVVGGAADHAGAWPQLPSGAQYAIDLVDAPAPLRPALRRLLDRIAVVDDLAAARQVVAQVPEVQAVTRDGDRLGSHFAEGGSSASQSLIEVTAALDEAEAELTEVKATLDRLRFEGEQADEALTQARERVDAVLERLHESDATMSAVAEKLGELGTTSRASTEEAERLEASIAQAKAAREQAMSGLAELEERVALAEQAPDTEPDTTEMERLAEEASAARRAETDARLALRTAEERARALATQVESMLAAAAAEREARQRAAERRERRRREAAVAAAVLRGIEVALSRLESSIALAAARRAQIEQDRSGREEQLRQTRSRLRDLEAELKQLTDSVHRDEMARSQLVLKLEQLHERALQEVGIEPDTLVAEYGPDQLVPVVGEDDAEPVPFVREEQVRRLRNAEKSLAMLGKVNPLALEEFSALEERHQFLSEQLDDLKKTRQDLLDIVDEVDQKVEQVFTEAWQDVEREFTDVFSRLFPGGEGKLVLTDPSSMLTTGIDVEARPPGKKVKRLSLLSGGERSLVAVAFLVSLFKARPSPFYILDEVEAALDDTNLGRLLEIYEELRATSQLIVITHQKRTMEVADALYGVSMRGDGVSAVVSQRLREEEESA
ncbi:chromosome segregation protein SMC [Aeromicrobium camelliae]|uniref:Chromosome partition protein Smc n=1 Tax=Aeromicrobium camelliae TaxID=1538144 RepID=A0A3N6X2H7_9ACTN|nr:chromosome segregation protein SMC [Aeromicrobium camelliae]RQN07853.1 chromosome segregation protein SMC [Aeromicrobium camelliae]